MRQGARNSYNIGDDLYNGKRPSWIKLILNDWKWGHSFLLAESDIISHLASTFAN